MTNLGKQGLSKTLFLDSTLNKALKNQEWNTGHVQNHSPVL